ncbi:MAG TPA: dipeptidase, partial [Candidatus Dormibacteraeota bacterium]|nr:dipeptidase [Candidatus Dormibacteraeota bacterium]
VYFLLLSSLALAQHPSTHKKAAKAAPVTRPKADPALTIHQSALIVDTHADTPQRFLDENFDLGQNTPLAEGHIDLDKIRQGNLGAEFFSIWVEPEFKGHYSQRAMDLIDSVYHQAARHPDKMTMAFSADDIARAHDQHKFAALMGIEGGHAIENDMRLLRDFYRIGVRYMTLTWSNTNEWADSSGDIQDPNVKHHNGMTDFGKDVVREMNRLGMIVDISHVSDATFYQALLVSQAPVIASHSSSRELTNQPRNMTDDMLRAMTNNGGVVMVNFYSAFIDENYRKASSDPEKIKQRDAEVDAYKKAHAHPDGSPVTYDETAAIEKKWATQFPRPPLKSLIDHIDHVAKVAGIDHVGLGSDFDGVTSLPEGIDSAADLPKITQALYQRGYTREQILKILGGNFMRVMRDVEATAKRLQAERKESDALSFEDIELMVGNRVNPAQLIDRVNQHGVSFDLTPERVTRLKGQKAEDSVVDAIAKARKK